MPLLFKNEQVQKRFAEKCNDLSDQTNYVTRFERSRCWFTGFKTTETWLVMLYNIAHGKPDVDLTMLGIHW